MGLMEKKAPERHDACQGDAHRFAMEGASQQVAKRDGKDGKQEGGQAEHPHVLAPGQQDREFDEEVVEGRVRPVMIPCDHLTEVRAGDIAPGAELFAGHGQRGDGQPDAPGRTGEKDQGEEREQDFGARALLLHNGASYCRPASK